MTTVGYGDVYPATAVGRVVGILVMMFGVAVFGVFTASVASYFSGSPEAGDETEALRTIDTRLQAIEQQLATLASQR